METTKKIGSSPVSNPATAGCSGPLCLPSVSGRPAYRGFFVADGGRGERLLMKPRDGLSVRGDLGVWNGRHVDGLPSRPDQFRDVTFRPVEIFARANDVFRTPRSVGHARGVAVEAPLRKLAAIKGL